MIENIAISFTGQVIKIVLRQIYNGWPICCSLIVNDPFIIVGHNKGNFCIYVPGVSIFSIWAFVFEQQSCFVFYFKGRQFPVTMAKPCSPVQMINSVVDGQLITLVAK